MFQKTRAPTPTPGPGESRTSSVAALPAQGNRTRGAGAEEQELGVSGKRKDTPMRATKSRRRSGPSVGARIASWTNAVVTWRLSTTPARAATPTARKGVTPTTAGLAEDEAPGRSARSPERYPELQEGTSSLDKQLEQRQQSTREGTEASHSSRKRVASSLTERACSSY